MGGEGGRRESGEIRMEKRSVATQTAIKPTKKTHEVKKSERMMIIPTEEGRRNRRRKKE